MHRLGLVAAWVLVAALATGLAWNVLSSADRQVGEAAASPLLTVGSEVGGPSVSAPGSSQVDPAIPGTDMRAGGPVASPTSQPTGSSTFTSATPASTSSTTTTMAPDSTTAPAPPSTSATSPTAPTTWSQSTITSGGGVVVVGHRPYEVRLDSATPAPGFVMEVEKQGPDEVRVEFESEDDSFEVRVRWDDGVLVKETD